MQLREALQRILDEYPSAQLQPLRGHPLANFIRSKVPTALSALVPTITSIFHDLQVTATGFPANGSTFHGLPYSIRGSLLTQKGVYIIYLFSEDGSKVLLSIGEGVTHLSPSDLADDRRKLLAAVAIPDGFQPGPAPAGILGQSDKARRYQNALVCFKVYDRSAIPDESQLRKDLTLAIQYIDSVIDSSVIHDLSFYGADNSTSVDSVNWRGRPITAEHVQQAFDATRSEDWSNRRGIEPRYVVWNEGSRSLSRLSSAGSTA